MCCIFLVWEESIFVSKMSDASVKSVFEKDTCKLV